MHKNTTLSERIVLTIIFSLVLVGLFLSYVNHDLFKSVYVIKDGPIEWLTFIALFTGMMICFKRAWSLRAVKSHWFIFMTAFIGFFFFLGAGEEISWGQRIFEIQSSDFFMKHNAQQETNFHNMVISGIKINKLVFGKILTVFILSYFFILPFIYKKYQSVSRLIDACAIPVPNKQHIVAFFILFILVQIVASSKRGELMEFGGSFIFLLTLIKPSNHKIYKHDAASEPFTIKNDLEK